MFHSYISRFQRTSNGVKLIPADPENGVIIHRLSEAHFKDLYYAALKAVMDHEFYYDEYWTADIVDDHMHSLYTLRSDSVADYPEIKGCVELYRGSDGKCVMIRDFMIAE